MVLTLTPTSLQEHCQRLSSRIQASGFKPMLIIGIQHGGAEVARLMRPSFVDSLYCEVRISRPSTKQKGEGLLHRLLQKLPLAICDLLRTIESRVNEWRSRGKQLVRVGQISLPDAICQALSKTPKASILLVDDAIDTGATIQQAIQQLKSSFPEADIRVAVITVTTESSVCEADFCLYHNRTLCRFPWSNDYRNA